jgi:hypothetical protein
MAEDGRVSALPVLTEYEPTATGGVSALLVVTEIQTAATVGVSALLALTEFQPVPVGVVSALLVMTEYNDSPLKAKPPTQQGYSVQGGARRIQGQRGRRRVGQWVPKKPTLDG